MRKNRVIKYRWIVLSAVVLSGLFTIAIAFGTPREGVTPVLALVTLVSLLIALAPVSMPKIVAHSWCVPISTTWSCSTIVAVHFAAVWLMGLGHQCDRVVLIANGVLWCVCNALWVLMKLYRWSATFARRKWTHSIQTAAM